MEAVKRFFSSPRFAVAGASNDSNKFGYKILAWYHQHSLPVTPLNPRAPKIELPSHAYDTVASPRALTAPSQTSLSVVTAPAVTLPLLQEAHAVGIPAVWLQPGTFDDAVLEFARKHFPAVIAGDGGAGSEGWCVLVDGEEGLEAAGVQWTSQKLIVQYVLHKGKEMPTSSFVLDSPIPPQLDLAGAPSQLFLPPNPSASSALFRSISIPSRKRARGVESGHRSWLDSPSSPTSFAVADDRLTGVDDVSAEHDYRPSRYRDPPLRLPLDSSVESLSDASGARRKRSRRDPSSVVAPSPSGPEDEKGTQDNSYYPQTAPVRWSRAVLDVVGKVWDFCWSGAFRGFYAGGGRGYSMTAGDPSVSLGPDDHSWQPTTEKHDLSSASAGTHGWTEPTPFSGDHHDDDLHHNWVVVGRDEFGYEASPSARRRVHRRTSSYGHLRRRQPVKRTFVSQPASITTKSHFSAPAKPRETPVSVETQRYMAQKRRMEREEDASLARLNRQLQAMIKEGQQALGTRVEVDDFMED
ncbi:CoA binding domain-containing protein [Aspergillus pseudocaelatus]|uniref:CoA binding domain-containing protein n=1 Tax=Aspergillus pseudocaelatus TaxID=1825620 RepID=A0ABQ6WJN8_9EURO|nr:CoA binding domain-containing protein [Aspergillus pseudocaelatus]